MGKRFTDWELDILFFKKTLLNVYCLVKAGHIYQVGLSHLSDVDC